MAHVGGSATPGANPSPGPPAVHEAAPIRGFKLPKSLSIACNAVGSIVQQILPRQEADAGEAREIHPY